jgi:hypothetical protein
MVAWLLTHAAASLLAGIVAYVLVSLAPPERSAP